MNRMKKYHSNYDHSIHAALKISEVSFLKIKELLSAFVTWELREKYVNPAVYFLCSVLLVSKLHIK